MITDTNVEIKMIAFKHTDFLDTIGNKIPISIKDTIFPKKLMMDALFIPSIKCSRMVLKEIRLLL
jgi:hypothetical protein